jgi:hypothetical protein
VITLPLARAVGDDKLPGTTESRPPHPPALALVRSESAQSDPAEGRGGEDASASSPSPRRGFATSLATSGRKAEQDQEVKQWRRRESNLGQRDPESPCETRTWPSKYRRSFRKVRSAAPRLVLWCSVVRCRVGAHGWHMGNAAGHRRPGAGPSCAEAGAQFGRAAPVEPGLPSRVAQATPVSFAARSGAEFPAGDPPCLTYQPRLRCTISKWP